VTYEQADDNVGGVTSAVEAHVEDVPAKLAEAKEAVEDKTEELKDAVEKKVEDVKEAVVVVVEETAAAVNAADVPTVVVIENKATVEANAGGCTEAVEQKPEQGTEPADKVEALEQKAKPLVVQFGKKGKKGQECTTVEFFYTPLGFEFNSQVKKAGCACVRPAKGPVVVTKVEEGQQAQTLGVETGMIIYKVNDKEIADLKQLQDLISQHCLPDKAACN